LKESAWNAVPVIDAGRRKGDQAKKTGLQLLGPGA
jgi:hypothetical protein